MADIMSAVSIGCMAFLGAGAAILLIGWKLTLAWVTGTIILSYLAWRN